MGFICRAGLRPDYAAPMGLARISHHPLEFPTGRSAGL